MIGIEGDNLSTTMAMERLKRKLKINQHSNKKKPKHESLEIKDNAKPYQKFSKDQWP